ncbi:MAG: DUF2096 family protein [Candidatus Bathyarchaeota archaeon]|nr:MAG: DUF2096 family protein [Candidatus Bathyarchaeota archaeon]
MVELRKRQIEVPQEIMTSLKSAKTMISISAADPNHYDSLISVEDHLLTVESALFDLAEKLGQDFVETWAKTLDDARRDKHTEVKRMDERPLRSLLKGKHWIRIKLSSEISEEAVKELASQVGLSCQLQEDERILVYGGKTEVRDFVKKMAEAQCRKR